MSEPKLTVEQADLINSWANLRKQIANIKPIVDEEMKLRKEIFSSMFPTPAEGVNDSPLHSGWVLKGTYKLDRKIDEAALPAAMEQLRALGVVADKLVAYKPSLVTSVYKELTAEQRVIFDTALEIKPASPTLELNPPKGKK